MANAENGMCLDKGSALVPAYSFNGDKKTGIYSPADDQVAVTCDGTAVQTFSASAVTSTVPQKVAATGYRNVIVAKVALAAADTGGGVFSWQNPEGADVLISRVMVNVTTQSSGACTVDVGTTATSGTTVTDNLIDGLSVAAVGLYSNLKNPGTNGKADQICASGKWVTASVASGASAGLAGFAYICYTVV